MHNENRWLLGLCFGVMHTCKIQYLLHTINNLNVKSFDFIYGIHVYWLEALIMIYRFNRSFSMLWNHYFSIIYFDFNNFFYIWRRKRNNTVIKSYFFSPSI